MGRPRKRQRTDEEPVTQHYAKSLAASPRPIQPAMHHAPLPYGLDIDPSLTPALQERTQFENVCNGPVAQTIRTQRTSSLQNHNTPGVHSNNSDTSPEQNGITTPANEFDPFNTAYPTDVAQWPDFSTLDMLPLPVEDKYSGVEPEYQPIFDPHADPHALSNLPVTPACPCLPNLYLTLSTMSTLSSFPFTQQTISTIESGYRTAKGVIYCPICPQKFDTGSSNLMLGCTLLNVLADQWNRVRRLGVEDLRRAFAPQTQTMFIGTKEGQEWRMFAHNLVRAYVFGDQPIPSKPGDLLPSIEAYPPVTLKTLCDALERRQRQWHRLETLTDEFPDRYMNQEAGYWPYQSLTQNRVAPELHTGHIVGQQDGHGGKHLCLEIVNHAKCVISKLAEPLHACR